MNKILEEANRRIQPNGTGMCMSKLRFCVFKPVVVIFPPIRIFLLGGMGGFILIF